MSSSVLTLNEVAVRRGDRLILGPINFSISQGERWVVLGPNGAGKSTLLQILATKIFPTQGTVSVLDKQMGKVDLFELRTRIGLCRSLQQKMATGLQRVNVPSQAYPRPSVGSIQRIARHSG